MSLLLALLLLGEETAPPAKAQTPEAIVEVVLLSPPSYPAPTTATLSLTSGEEHKDIEAPLPGRMQLPAVGGRAVTLAARAEGLWAAPVVVLPPGRAEIRFVPAGYVHGRVAVARGATVPRELRLYFGASAAPGETGETVCPIDTEGAFSCLVPANTLDLHLRAEGFVSLFFWDKTIAPGKVVDLGALELLPGSSLTGWVRTEDGKPLDGTCHITLHRSGAQLSGEARQRLRLNLLQMTRRPDGRGFFHFAGVAPGTYDLVAQQKGYVDAVRQGVVVLENLEARLVGDMVLARPRSVTVDIVPARAPSGERWFVRLLRLSSSGAEEAGGKLADEQGVVTFAGCAPGDYVILVAAEDKRWAEQPFAVGDADAWVSVNVGLLRVVGRVWLGKEPLAGATVFFGGRTGAPSVELHPDSNGAFEGFLPRGGDWRVDGSANSLTVERSFLKVPVARRPGRDHAEVELRLPDSRLQGTVADEMGVPPEHALVRVRPLVADEEEVFADASGGAFDVRGLAAGTVEVRAETRDAISDPVVVNVAPEGTTGPLHLVLYSYREVHGHVTGPRGVVPGALVYLRPLGVAGTEGAELHTDAQGAFTAKLRKSVREVVVSVMAPGYAWALGRVRLPEEGELALALSEARGAVKLRLPFGSEEAILALHNGGSQWAGAIYGWAHMNPGERQFDKDRNELTVPALEAGEWQFCVAPTGSAAWISIWVWGAPVPEHCVQQHIEPGRVAAVDLGGLAAAKP